MFKKRGAKVVDFWQSSIQEVAFYCASMSEVCQLPLTDAEGSPAASPPPSPRSHCRCSRRWRHCSRARLASLLALTLAIDGGAEARVRDALEGFSTSGAHFTRPGIAAT